MKEEITVLKFDKYEMGILINALNDFRNRMIEKSEYTDCVDELFMKVLNAPTRKAKVFESR